jgi:hypothetical protein
MNTAFKRAHHDSHTKPEGALPGIAGESFSNQRYIDVTAKNMRDCHMERRDSRLSCSRDARYDPSVQQIVSPQSANERGIIVLRDWKLDIT